MTQLMADDEVVTKYMGKPLYKVLMGLESCNGGKAKWRVGEWKTVEGDLTMCERGLHLTTEPYKAWYKWGATIYRGEAKGIVDVQDDKVLCRSARVVEALPDPPWLGAAKEFVAGLKDIAWLKPDGKPLPEWKLFTGETWDAAWDAARGAARGAAIMACLLIVSDLDFPDKANHMAHAEARMQVWRKGYGLRCDVGGVLYVYAKREAGQ